MKAKILWAVSAVLAIAMIFSSFGWDRPDKRGGRETGASSGPGGTGADFASVIAHLPAEPLSDAEKEGLRLLREEEKLARDVYLFLGDKYGSRIFFNIAESEAFHMESVKVLLDKYGMEDPAEVDVRGVFTNPEISALYARLTAKGGVSAAEALRVGAFVEDLDIADLEKALSRADNADLRVLYQNLYKGSRNHIRAFDRQLRRAGAAYEPEFITFELYRKIVSSNTEKGGLSGGPNRVF